MVKIKKDLTGMRFGRLIVVSQTEDYIKPCGRRTAAWICKCDCGNTIRVVSSQLISHKTQSCGCLRKQKNKERLHKVNQYDLSGEYGIGWTSNTNQEFYFDLEDYDKIKDYSWWENTYGYCTTTINKKHIQMHKIISNYKIVDHYNRNRLDNRKENLKDSDYYKNNQNSSISNKNTSGYIGISFDNPTQKWTAQICINGKQTYLGRREKIEDAIILRLKAEKKIYGENAPQRHLFKEYNII